MFVHTIHIKFILYILHNYNVLSNENEMHRCIFHSGIYLWKYEILTY